MNEGDVYQNLVDRIDAQCTGLMRIVDEMEKMGAKVELGDEIAERLNDLQDIAENMAYDAMAAQHVETGEEEYGW